MGGMDAPKHTPKHTPKRAATKARAWVVVDRLGDSVKGPDGLALRFVSKRQAQAWCDHEAAGDHVTVGRGAEAGFVGWMLRELEGRGGME